MDGRGDNSQRVNESLIAQAASAGVCLGGSLLAFEEDERDEVAAEMAAHGLMLHADVLDDSFVARNGVSAELLERLAGHFGDRLDVHVMVRQVGEVALRLPSARFARLTVHVNAQDESAAKLSLRPARAAEYWIGLDPAGWVGPAALQHLDAVVRAQRPDGILVMLTPPGVPGRAADLDLLGSAVWALAGCRPRGTDGGVTAENLERIVAAGASYVVAGRALR